jgi:serine/threonine-protein kinase
MTERFTLLSELGRGGMGVVWKARDEETGQIVALKLLREAYAEDPDYLARFERELELAKRIDSVHVVKVLGYGVRQKVPYLALEYVDGPSLHGSLTQHGPYSWAETRALLIQVTQGLADANAAGVIHRDVKPSNVLLGPDDVAKLTDFGIARGLDTTRMTATSTMLGTPAYMAPEGPKDARSDLYSLGIIGYELLTGAVPFRGTSYQDVIVEHIRTAPDLAKVPPEARPTIAWLLAKDPAARPQRASALLPVLYGAAQAPAVQGSMAQIAVAPAPMPIAPVRAPVPTPPPGWGAPQKPFLAPPPGWGGQAIPPPMPGARWAAQPAAGAFGAPRTSAGSGRAGPIVVLVGAVVELAACVFVGLVEDYYAQDTFALTVLAGGSAVVMAVAGQRLTRRRALGIWCALLGLAILWTQCSWVLTNFSWLLQLDLWLPVDEFRVGWDASIAGGVVVVIGGVISAVTARSAASPSPSPGPRR